MESTGDGLTFVPDETLLRVLCHVLIERLPAEAIGSVWESVHDAWNWHSRPRLSAPAENLPALPAVNRVFAVVDEPAFRIAEE